MKNNKGFTLVEIIVVLVILAILAAATIPSMLGFVNDAKAKADIAEVRAVFVAAQAYASEKVATGTANTAVQTSLNDQTHSTADSDHVLYGLLNGDADGKISKAIVNATSGKVESFYYTKTATGKIYFFQNGSGISPTTSIPE